MRRPVAPGAMERLGFATRLIGELLWLGFDLLFGRALSRLDGVPRSVSVVDAAWLTSVLAASAPGTVVTKVEVLGKHSGTTSRARLRVGRDAGDRTPTHCRSLFLKLTPASSASRLFTTLLQLGASEVDFYRHLGSGFPIRIPRVHCARRAPRGGRFVLLMEDLEASGCRFPSGSSSIDASGAREVVATLARLHAAFWESPRFSDDLAWLTSYENNPRRTLEWWLSARSDGPALAKFGELVPESVRSKTRRIHANRPLLEAHWARAPRTLIHGDPHAGNLFFDGDEAGLFDWQVVQIGPGLRDVSYFLVNSLDTDLRRTHERALIEHYLVVLAEGGVSGLQISEAWNQYRLFSLYAWIAAAVTAAAATLQSRAVIERAVARTGQALQDLAAFKALDALTDTGEEGAER